MTTGDARRRTSPTSWWETKEGVYGDDCDPSHDGPARDPVETQTSPPSTEVSKGDRCDRLSDVGHFGCGESSWVTPYKVKRLRLRVPLVH